MLRSVRGQISAAQPGNRARPALRVLPRLAMVAGVLCSVLVGSWALSDVASAATTPPPGQITGNVTVATAPAGFGGIVGILACPAAAATGSPCPSPQYTVSGSGGSYTLGLPAGTWQVTGFYELDYQSGAFLGPSRAVTVASGGTVRQNLSIRYQAPSSISGSVAITGVPTGVEVSDLDVTACPAWAPIVGGTPSPFCATTSAAAGSDDYTIATLPQGSWLLYPGYYTEFGPTIVTTPTTVSLPRNAAVTADLSAPYQTPTDALVEGTVTVTGAPAGFEGIPGVGACPLAKGPAKPCPNPQYTLTGSGGGSYQLTLAAGKWELAGFYELAPFAGQFLGALHDVSLTGGTIVTLNVTVPYKAPASVTATVTVTGVPVGVAIEDLIVLACPSSTPYDGLTEPTECVEGGSPAGSPVTLDTLPPGRWLLYPGYVTSTTELVSTTPKRVKLVSGATTASKLTIAYGTG
jgi:hypothetical protein